MSPPDDDDLPSRSSFLFVNKNASNLRSKAHAGAVNAHVHADARAKKQRAAALRQASTDKGASSEPLQRPLHSMRIEERSTLQRTNSQESSSDTFIDKLKPKNVRSRRSSSTVLSTPVIRGSLSAVASDSDPPTSASLTKPEHISQNSSEPELHVALHRFNPWRQSSRSSSQSRIVIDDDITPAEHEPYDPGILMPIASTALDPFCILPIETSKHEQSLAQYYLQMMPTMIYGTRPDAIFCPVRDITFPNMSNDPLVLLWVMNQSEGFQGLQRNLQVHPESLLRRKATAYRMMNQRLSDPAQQCSEDTFGGMIAAATIDARLSGSNVGSLHLNGLNHLLRKRGGLKALYSDKKLMGSPLLFVWCHHLSHGAGGIDNVHDLKTYKHEFLRILNDIQDWNTQLRRQLIQLRARSAVARLTSSDELYKAYEVSRKRAFSATAVLRPLIEPHRPCGSLLERTCHFSNLFALNLTLWIFRNDPALGTAFLDRIVHHMELSGVIDPITKVTSLTPNALIWIIPRVRCEVNVQEDDEDHKQEVWLSWMVIHALKIIAFVDEEKRTALVIMLSNWLTCDGQDEMICVSEDEFAEISSEICRNWMAEPR